MSLIMSYNIEVNVWDTHPRKLVVEGPLSKSHCRWRSRRMFVNKLEEIAISPVWCPSFVQMSDRATNMGKTRSWLKPNDKEGSQWIGGEQILSHLDEQDIGNIGEGDFSPSVSSLQLPCRT